MKTLSADQILAGLSEDLQDLIVREAFIRRHQADLTATLAELRAKEAEFSRTRPPFLAFRKEAKQSFEAAGQKLRDDIAAMERQLAKCVEVLQKCDRAVVSEFEGTLAGVSDAWRNSIAAEKLLPEWEQAVGMQEVAVRQLLTALGVARNQMASAYDHERGAFAPGAQEALERAQAAARTVDAEAVVPNQLARRFRELLGVPAHVNAPGALLDLPVLGRAKQVAALGTMKHDEAQAQMRRLIEETERLHDSVLPAARAALQTARGVRELERTRQITTPLTEIRAHADTAVDPAQFDEVWESMVARFG